MLSAVEMKIFRRSLTLGAGTVGRDKRVRSTFDRLNELAVAVLVIRNQVLVGPVVRMSFFDDWQLINLKLLVFRRMS